MRADGRRPDELRPVQIVPGFVEQAHGSALISLGRTRVLCTATVEDGVPRWLEGRGEGWLTAEYGMLPASSGERIRREASAGRQKGRTIEIQRLIGRSLRAAYEMRRLAERTVWIDCDVIQADGGTRTAAVSGAWIALSLAARRVGLPAPDEQVAAVSVGLVGGTACLDLDYAEDSSADVDMNVAMTVRGGLIDVQATAEGRPFPHEMLEELLALARDGVRKMGEEQQSALERA
ncbi:MAG: ribonuclease PH [Thermoleophilia bacterium]|nr:ribonuclease PH [Thermoleophilia bacterium]